LKLRGNGYDALVIISCLPPPFNPSFPPSLPPSLILFKVAEGYATTFSLVELIEKLPRAHKRERTFPIIYAVKSILDGTYTPQEGVRCVTEREGREGGEGRREGGRRGSGEKKEKKGGRRELTACIYTYVTGG
jgi:hypothetical protein